MLGFGLDYFPIRKLHLREGSSRPANKVLVTTGATSDEKILNSLIQASQESDFEGFTFNLLSPKLPTGILPENWIWSETGRELEVLAKVCDTVITAAGTSLWDFLANGFPVATFPLVANQNTNYEFAVTNDLAIPLYEKNPNVDEIKKSLYELLLMPERRLNLVNNSLQKLDFEGPRRFSNLLLSRI